MTQSKRNRRTPNVLVDEPPLSAENLPTDIQSFQQKIMHCLPEQSQRSEFPKFRYIFTDEILAQYLGSHHCNQYTDLCHSEYTAEKLGKKRSQPWTLHNALQQRLVRKIKQLRSDVSELSEIAKENVIKNQEWLRKLRDTPVTTSRPLWKQQSNA